MEVVVIDHASPMQYQVSGQRLAQSVPTAGSLECSVSRYTVEGQCILAYFKSMPAELAIAQHPSPFCAK
jgi:hypothetical protein